ncbi:hypothetical protein CEXT_600731 [Caerostris extrusa]|uniref:Uncharacterized protein n=1 Tax=Caerostris extrusa TaxID=172846 RepID=A0AAV4NFX3_CAEEX|nr:hypothetical protein CEXT_600731 [Caerostris extrusa]
MGVHNSSLAKSHDGEEQDLMCYPIQPSSSEYEGLFNNYSSMFVIRALTKVSCREPDTINQAHWAMEIPTALCVICVRRSRVLPSSPLGHPPAVLSSFCFEQIHILPFD